MASPDRSMADLCILRKQFLDRFITMDELASLTEMLRAWYLGRAGNRGRGGQSRCESHIYAFPRPHGEVIWKSLSAKLRDATFDTSDPDTLRVVGPDQSVDNQPDLSVWREALVEPSLQHTCVLLRLTFTGPVAAFAGVEENGTTTLVICGAPVGGALLAKAIWQVGHDESMQLVYRAAPWHLEQKLLEQLDLYLREHQRIGQESAAQAAFARFGKAGRNLFTTRRNESRAMWLTRQIAELPDDRSPMAFLRRFGVPLLVGTVLAVLSIASRQVLPNMALISADAAAVLLLLAGWTGWRKLRQIARYHSAMNRGLGMHYSNPVHFQQTDLSSDRTPTLVKCSIELEALGAKHVCDISITNAKHVYDSNRVYAIGKMTVMIGVLRKTESYFFFPPRPIILISSRFDDGRQHVTAGQPVYRKQSHPKRTARCLPRNGGIDEVIALHRRHLDQLIAAGAKPVLPLTTAREILERMRCEHEEARELWQKAHYSWSDALHDAFKICRREYLAD